MTRETIKLLNDMIYFDCNDNFESLKLSKKGFKLLVKYLEYLQKKVVKLDSIEEKLKEHKYDLDYEPWSIYKIDGSILFDLVSIIKECD